MNQKILAFGEILWDIIEGEPKIGGAPLNFAGHARQLGAEAEILSALGQDELGHRALERLDELGVGRRRVLSSSLPTGEARVEMTGGIPAFTILENRAWDAIELSDKTCGEIAREGWDVLYYGTLAQRGRISRESLRRLWNTGGFPRRFFDVNIRQAYYSPEIIKASLEAATMAKLNDEEVVLISPLIYGRVLGGDDFAERLRNDYDLELLCLTYGARGAVIYHGAGEKSVITPPPVKAVDTVGAGDSFSAALVTLYGRTGDVEWSGRRAQEVASHVVTQPGAIQPYPPELRRRLGLD